MNNDVQKSQRNMGIEFLRMVLIYMIMVLHTLGKGGVLANLTPLSASYDTAWFLEILSYPSGVVFGLIAGYVGFDHDHRVSDAIYIWLEVMFYTVIGSAIFFVLMPETVTREAITNMLFPVMSESYWYVSAYIGVFFFMNGINYSVKNMPEGQVKTMFVAAIMLFCVFPILSYTDVFALRLGCSILSIGCFYFFGACMKRFGLLEKYSSKVLFLIFVICILLTWGFKIAGETILGYDEMNPERFNRLLAYYSPPIVLSGMCLLVIFSRMNIRGFMMKIVKVASSLAFGVYLLNAQPLVFRYLMADRFAVYATYGPAKMAVCVLLAALCLYCIGTAVDAIRNLIFGLTGLKQRLRAVENHIIARRS
ncbi:MAG: acyltransferase [Lachnospiraceae bacterium]|nr:acyltransferase [Lachnospiraceae bacterium]